MRAGLGRLASSTEILSLTQATDAAGKSGASGKPLVSVTMTDSNDDILTATTATTAPELVGKFDFDTIGLSTVCQRIVN